jgi:hypothetical protein
VNEDPHNSITVFPLLLLFLRVRFPFPAVLYGLAVVDSLLASPALPFASVFIFLKSRSMLRTLTLVGDRPTLALRSPLQRSFRVRQFCSTPQPPQEMLSVLRTLVALHLFSRAFHIGSATSVP